KIAGRAMDRIMAEWVLARGGLVEVMVPGKPAPVSSAKDPLPKEPFRVVTIRLEAAKAVDDQALDTFRDLAELKSLVLDDCLVTDEGLARFAASPGAANLVHLRIQKAPISDAGLAALQNLRRLEDLGLAGCRKVTSAGLKHLRNVPLRVLGL